MLSRSLALVAVVVCTSYAHADFTNSYSYSQDIVSFTNVTTTESKSVSSTSAQFDAVPESATYSTFSFTALANQESASASNFQLKSASGIDVNIASSTDSMDDQFTKLTAQASSTTMFSDTVQVTGVPNGTVGFIEFNWALTGSSSLTATESSGYPTLLDNYQVDVELKIDALGQAIPPLASTLTPSVLGVNNATTTKSEGLASGAILLPVTFTDGTTIPVDFTLSTDVSMIINPMDPVGYQFVGNLHADYDGTAILTDVALLDASFDPIIGAAMASTTGKGAYTVTAVPEPSAFAFGLAILPAVICVRLIKRRFGQRLNGQ